MSSGRSRPALRVGASIGLPACGRLVGGLRRGGREQMWRIGKGGSRGDHERKWRIRKED